MILARPPPAPFLCELSGKSDPLTDRQIDSSHMAHNSSVVAVIVNMHFFFFFCTKLHLSFPHGARNPPVLVSSFLVCYVFSFTTVAFYSTLPCLLFVSLGTERLPWSTWTPWRACKYLYFIVHAPFIGAFLPCSCCSSHC